MILRAVEISGDGRHISKEHGFLVVSQSREELGRLPLDDLEVVLLCGHGATCTAGALNALAERCIPLVLCDHTFMPASMLWPVESHRLQSGRIRAQAALTLPARKRLWQQVVRAKIAHQAEILQLCTGHKAPRLESLARGVRSGDTANAEGEAARIYWPLLFGEAFRRERGRPGVNILLNYGYTVLRAAVARAVMLAGLHPAFGLHHRSLRDTMPLVDDLIEPFRPLVDLLVFVLISGQESEPELNPEVKKQLTTVTALDLVHEGVASPVSECLLRMTRSLAEVCEGRERKLALPRGLRQPEDQEAQ